VPISFRVRFSFSRAVRRFAIVRHINQWHQCLCALSMESMELAVPREEEMRECSDKCDKHPPCADTVSRASKCVASNRGWFVSQMRDTLRYAAIDRPRTSRKIYSIRLLWYTQRDKMGNLLATVWYIYIIYNLCFKNYNGEKGSIIEMHLFFSFCKMNEMWIKFTFLI